MAIKKSQIGEEISSSLVPVTNKCNQNCLHCSTREIFRNLDFSLKSTLKRVHQIGNLITLTGGEPTLSPNLFKIIDFAKRERKKVELFTNGTTLSYLALAQKLFLSKVDLFNIGLSAYDENLYNKITRTRGLFKAKVKGIKNLEKLGANIKLTYPIHTLNYKHLSKFIDWVKKNFQTVKSVQFNFLCFEGEALKNSWLVPKYEKVEPYLISAFKKCSKYKIDFIVDHIPPCFLGDFFEHHIDLRKLKMNAVFELKHSLKEKKKIEVCSGCQLNSLCCGPRKDYLKLWKNKIVLKPIYVAKLRKT